MKKYKVVSTICGVFLIGSAHAHDLWVNAEGSVGQAVRAEIGYGHDFPHAEKIPEKRLGLFAPMRFFSERGESVLTQRGENYQYSGDAPLQKGIYLVTAAYKPTFWTEKTDGKWVQDQTRKETPDAKYCEQAAMFGKTVLNIGNSKSDFAAQAVGQKLEIVPVDNPADYRVGKPFVVQVWYDGKPLKTVKLSGTFAGFPKEQKAFLGSTDLQGKIAVTPLAKGQWMLQVEHKIPFENPKICDEYVYVASLTVPVK